MRTNTAVVAWVALVLAGCGGEADDPDVRLDEDVQALAQGCGSDVVITLEHHIATSNGATLHLVEKLSLASILAPHRRAIVMLPATLVTNVIWNAAVPGAVADYNALDRAARQGYFAFTLDWEGYGGSSAPASGFDVTAERLVAESGDVVKWVRKHRGVKKVDVLGSSLGSAIAVALGGEESPIDHHRVGHIVLTAHSYAQVTPLAEATLFSDESLAFLLSSPAGYITTVPAVYGIITAFAEPEAQAYCDDACPGTYAVGPTLEGFDLPVFDASAGRAPMLQFWGDQDLVTPLSDALQFQSEYGGEGQLVVLPGGGHVPHWESVRDEFWAQTFAFLDD